MLRKLSVSLLPEPLEKFESDPMCNPDPLGIIVSKSFLKFVLFYFTEPKPNG
jgi:hypothetical protein